jgi:NhaA family Na+:H+ antiporter
VPRSQRVTAALLRFFQSDVAGGVVLTAAAVVALAWANSPWKASYFRIWDQPAHLSGRAFADFTTVQSWVNGGLMALFFLVVGLEIARERREGDLADTRTAVVPVVGALGGMIGAALVYAVANHGGPGARGWGIPMATDIAFALGALALLGRRVPPGLRLLLLTLAVADDVGSVSVLAIFYSARTWLPGLVGAVVVTAAMVAARRRWPTSGWPFLVGGVGLWLFLSSAGIEPALAGVVVGLVVPGGSPAGGPAGRMEYVLAPVSAYLVLPLFALANAGITLGSSVLHHRGATAVFGGIVAARVVGKLIGITLACALVVRLGWGRLPDGLRWVHVAGGAAVAGIGFTVPLLIAEHAFRTNPALVTASELGLLVGSVAALGVGMAILELAWRGDRRRARSGPTR